MVMPQLSAMVMPQLSASDGITTPIAGFRFVGVLIAQTTILSGTGQVRSRRELSINGTGCLAGRSHRPALWTSVFRWRSIASGSCSSRRTSSDRACWSTRNNSSSLACNARESRLFVLWINNVMVQTAKVATAFQSNVVRSNVSHSSAYATTMTNAPECPAALASAVGGSSPQRLSVLSGPVGDVRKNTRCTPSA